MSHTVGRMLTQRITCTVVLGITASGALASDQIETIQRLLAELEKRDLAILDLKRRVTELEARTRSLPAPTAPTTWQGTLPHGAESATLPPSPQQAATSRPAKTKTAHPDTAAPGRFEVDEEAADRALERTLVQSGVLLLPAGQGEIQPSLEYARNESVLEPRLTLPSTLGSHERLVLSERRRRNTFTGDIALRFGLPFDAQVEFGIPYYHVEQSNVLAGGPGGPEEISRTGSGFGDFRIGLAKTLVQEDGWFPDLVARATWDMGNGAESDSGLALGGGFDQLRFAASALKRQDPLAFSALLSYEIAPYEHDGIEPGNQISLEIGAALAASPETSLQFSFSQTFTDELKVDGKRIESSDSIIGVLRIGASTVVGRRSLLSISAGFGMSGDAADYSLGISFGQRFDIPGI